MTPYRKCNQKKPRNDVAKRAFEGGEEKSNVDGTDPKKSDELVKLGKDLASCVIQTDTNGIIRDDLQSKVKICSLQRLIPESAHFSGTFYYLLTMTIPVPLGNYVLIPIEQITNNVELESANIVAERDSNEHLGNSEATECTTEISGDSETTEYTDDTSEDSDDSSDLSNMDYSAFMCCDQCPQAYFSAGKKKK